MIMVKFAGVLGLVFLVGVSFAADGPSSTSSYLTVADKENFKNLLNSGLKFEELTSTYYTIVGYKQLKEQVKLIGEACEFLINSAKRPSVTTEQLFYIAGAWEALERCQPKSLPISTLLKSLTAVLEKDDSTIPDLYYAINALVSFKQKIPDNLIPKIVKNLQASVKKDDSPLNLGHIFHIAAKLGPQASFAFNHIQDAIVQADEVDGRYLQFEGGLSVTSFLVNGVFKLSSTLKKKPSFKPNQITKLANYFLSRRSVQTPKGVVNLLTSINILATNEFEKPICISLVENGAVISKKQPFIQLKICDVLGNVVPSINNVVANSASKIGNDEIVLSKKNFQQSPNDKTLFNLNFMTVSPASGFYKIAVSAGAVSNVVTVKVISEVKVEYLEIGTADADQTTQPKLVKISYPNNLGKKIEADSLQKLVIRFLLKDTATNKPIRVHQAFVRLSSISSNDKSKDEIIFVAEPDASHVYKFDMPVGAEAKNFNYQSGDYSLDLIVGDAALSNSFEWTLATVHLKFPDGQSSEAAEKSTYRQKPNVYSPKPEIKHMFREPEKRPPAFVSNLFTGLCALPLLILIILWAKIGVNISNFPFSISAIVFHLGLGSIFVLFGVFWVKLNMFTTLRYLMGLGLITFLAGNKMLSQIAQNRKAAAAR